MGKGAYPLRAGAEGLISGLTLRSVNRLPWQVQMMQAPLRNSVMQLRHSEFTYLSPKYWRMY